MWVALFIILVVGLSGGVVYVLNEERLHWKGLFQLMKQSRDSAWEAYDTNSKALDEALQRNIKYIESARDAKVESINLQIALELERVENQLLKDAGSKVTDDQYHDDFVATLKMRMEENKLTPTALARAINAETSYVHAILRGRIKPSKERLQPLMYEAKFHEGEVFHFNTNYLPSLQKQRKRRKD